MASTITANSNGLFFTADTSSNIEISSTQVNVTSNLNVTGNVTSNNTITNRTYGSNNNGDPIIIIKNAAVSNALTFNPNEGNNLIHFYGNGTIQASGNVLANNFASTGNGVPTITSTTNINLTASAAVVVTNSPLRLRSFTTAQIANLTPMSGDLVYNSTTNQFQGYANNNWVNLNGNVV